MAKKLMANQKAFYLWLATKILESFASVSIWGFLIVFFTSTWLCYIERIDSDTWGLVISIGFGIFLGYRGINKKIKKGLANELD